MYVFHGVRGLETFIIFKQHHLGSVCVVHIEIKIWWLYEMV